MSVGRRLNELQKECEAKGLPVTPKGKRVSKRDYVVALQNHSLKTMYPNGAPKHLDFMIKLETPMLCFRYDEMDDEFKRDVWKDSTNWYAEPKINGCRMLVIYSKEEGLHFYSRNISVKDFLPVEYDNIWIPKFDAEQLNLMAGVNSFILDAEVLCPQTKVDTTMSRLSSGGVITETNLAATTALLSLNKEDSLSIQKDNGIQLEFHCFQVLELNGQKFNDMVYHRMKQVLEVLVGHVKGAGLNVVHVPTTTKDKKAFYDSQIAAGGEGIVLKRADATYQNSESRYHRMWIKVKRLASTTFQEAGLGDSIDAFVIGALQGNEGTGFQELVGALRMGVYLKMNDGTEKVHEIANCPNIELVLRKELTVVDANGKYVGLRPDYVNTVWEIDGQWISAREHRLVHPRLVRTRTDKSPEQCIFTEALMKKMIV